MAVDAASSYQNAVTQTDLQYLQDGWQLEDEEAQELHNSRKKVHLSIWWIWFERILCRENMR